jgi:hypothetical protein
MGKYVKVGTIKKTDPATEPESTGEPSESTSRDVDASIPHEGSVWPHLFFTLLFLLSRSRAKHNFDKVLKIKSVFFIMKKTQHK